MADTSTGIVDPKTQTNLGNGTATPIPNESTPNDQIHNGQELDAKTKLYQKLDKMPPFKRMVFLKMMQFNILSETLDAVNNGKNTPKKVWGSVIGKMYAIKDMNVGKDKSGIDFRKIIAMLLPLIGMLAGLFLALREAEKAEQEAAEPDTNPEFPDTVNSETAAKKCAEEKAKNLQRSIVMQLCEAKEKGFSLN